MIEMFYVVLCLALLCFGCTKTSSPNKAGENSRSTSTPSVVSSNKRDAESCDTASKQILGASARVFLCGSLSVPGVLEVFTGVRLEGIEQTQSGTPVSKFAILRRNGQKWDTELIADRLPVRNPLGFVGATNIDDSYGYSRYMIEYDEKPFSLMVRFIHGEQVEDGWPLEIDWNPAAGRYQEYSQGDSPSGFVEETKKPRHINRKPNVR